MTALYRRDVKKKHKVGKVIQRGGKYIVELPETWANDVEYVVMYKVLPVR